MAKPWTGPPLKQCPQHGHFTAAVCPVCSQPEPGNMTWEEKRHANQTDTQIPDAKPQRDKAPALDATVQRETESVPSTERRPRVRFTGYRVQCLDPDNFAGSVKDLLDGCKHAGLIPDDAPDKIVLETAQVKVSKRKEERTLIEIETLI